MHCVMFRTSFTTTQITHSSYAILSSVPGSHHSIFVFFEINIFRFHVWVRLSGTCLQHLAYLTWWSPVPYFHKWQFYSFILFYGWIILHCLHVHTVLHFLYPFSSGGPLICFHFFIIMNSAALNLSIQMFILQQTEFISFRYIHFSLWFAHLVDLFLILWGTSLLFPVCDLYFHQNIQESSFFSILLPSLVSLKSFDNSLIGMRWDLTVVLIWIFLLVMLSNFSCMCWLFVCLFLRNLCLVNCPVFDLSGVCFVCF